MTATKSYIIPFWINPEHQNDVTILMGVIKELPNHSNANTKQPYTFSFLGGTCEKGESPEQCLIRELFEETTGYMCLSLKDLNPSDTMQFRYPYKDGYIQIYAIPIRNLQEIAHVVNYHHGQNMEFKPEFLEYHFIMPMPLEKLLKMPKVYPSTYRHQEIDTRKYWRKNIEEYLTSKNKKDGVWYLSDAILLKMLNNIIKQKS